jgi:PAS domain S-box-containing protein
MYAPPRTTVGGYLVAVAIVGLTVGLISLSGTLIRAPITMLVAAVTLSAWYGGLGPGLLATLLTVVAIDQYFVPQSESGALGVDDFVRVCVFALVAALISSLTDRRRKAEERSHQVNAELEARVKERTEELSQTNAQLQTSIGECRRAADTLQASEERFRRLFENMLAGVIHSRIDGQIVDCNEAFVRLLGYPSREAVRACTSWDFYFSRGEREAVIARLRDQSVLQGVELRLRRRDGQPVWVLGSVSLLERGPNSALQGAFIDITDRKRAEDERRQLEAQMQHAQKLESLGVLAGGIAHDFNNLLTGVLGHASLALMDLPPDAPACHSLQQIEVAARRAADLTRQLLAYSGKGRFLLAPVDLSRIIEETAALLKTVVSKKATLHFDFAPQLPTVIADPAQIRQIVMNLLTNASEALGDGPGAITLRTGKEYATRAYLAAPHVPADIPEGGYIFLEVTDTGGGMDAHTLERIFDPFFSTKFTGRGLGLAAVLGIVRSHRGAIKVKSEAGRGSTFKVLLPPADLQTGDASDAALKSGEWRGRGVVLVVDDEDAVRTVARETLERAGFEVLLASDGRAGIELFREKQADIAAVLLDGTMRQPDGDAVFRELRRLRPDVRVILMSGYNEQGLAGSAIGPELAGFLQKPFHAAELLATVRRALDG